MPIQRLPVLLILAIPLLTSCIDLTSAETPIPTINYTVITSGDHTLSGIPENKKIEIFTDQTSLNNSLALYTADTHTIDFSTRRAALLSMGLRNSGGYSIIAERISDYGDYIKLHVLMTKPGNGCITTLALTMPFQFIEIESTKEIVFDERVQTVNCT